MAASMEVESDFARKQLAKHGWTKGKGLGKSENGMQNPIKVAFKNDKVGIGVNPSEEFTFHWWDHVFNKVANKIQVNSDGKDTTTDVSQDLETEISTKKPTKHSKSKKNHVYGRFVSGGLLKGEGEIQETNNEDIEIKNMSKTDTIDKVFKETGFTAHKAARHGHRLSGKLKRLQEQEEAILKRKETVVVVETENIEMSKKKKKKKKRKHEESLELDSTLNNEESISLKSNTKRSKREKR